MNHLCGRKALLEHRLFNQLEAASRGVCVCVCVLTHTCMLWFDEKRIIHIQIRGLSVA